jgi:hypothetical protein
MYLRRDVPSKLIAADTIEVCVRLAELTFHEDQKFSTPKGEFGARLRQWYDRELPPVLTLPGVVKFSVRGQSQEVTPYLIKDKELVLDLLNRYRSHFEVSAEDRADRIKSLSKLAGCEDAALPPPGSKEEREFIKAALKQAAGGKHLSGALKSVRGLLPEVTGLELQLPKGDEPLSVRSFYQSLKDAFEGHIPETLKSWGIELDERTRKIFIENYLKPVQGELGKFATGSQRQEQRTVQVVATKGVYDAFYDAIGENCSGQYGFELENSIFQPLRLIDPDTGEHYGVVYALKGTVEGERALILAGVEIRKQFAYGIKQSDLIPALIGELGKIAKHNGCQEIWTTVGEARGDRPWSDDGRISQYDVTREALCGMGQTYKDLMAAEQIQFPRKFSAPIHRVLRVWADSGEIAENKPNSGEIAEKKPEKKLTKFLDTILGWWRRN